jgi:hypothetical protein
MDFLFLLKKKSEGGISSAEIDVRSSIKMTSELGFSQLDYKGVNEKWGYLYLWTFVSLLYW